MIHYYNILFNISIITERNLILYQTNWILMFKKNINELYETAILLLSNCKLKTS